MVYDKPPFNYFTTAKLSPERPPKHAQKGILHGQIDYVYSWTIQSGTRKNNRNSQPLRVSAYH
jgi:hypothetical protein